MQEREAEVENIGFSPLFSNDLIRIIQRLTSLLKLTDKWNCIVSHQAKS